MGMRQRRRRVIALTAAGVLGVFAVLPHPLEHLAQFIATGVLIAIAAVAGALLAPRVGLVTPIIDAALSGQLPESAGIELAWQQAIAQTENLEALHAALTLLEDTAEQRCSSTSNAPARPAVS